MTAADLREAADFGPLLRRWQAMLRDPVVQERLPTARYLELERLISLGEGLLTLPNPGTAKGPSGAEVCQALTAALAKIYTSTPGDSELWHTSATLAALRTLDGSAFGYDAATEVLSWQERLERCPKKQGKSTAQLLAGLREGLKIDFAVLLAGADAPPQRDAPPEQPDAPAAAPRADAKRKRAAKAAEAAAREAEAAAATALAAASAEELAAGLARDHIIGGGRAPRATPSSSPFPAAEITTLAPAAPRLLNFFLCAGAPGPWSDPHKELDAGSVLAGASALEVLRALYRMQAEERAYGSGIVKTFIACHVEHCEGMLFRAKSGLDILTAVVYDYQVRTLLHAACAEGADLQRMPFLWGLLTHVKEASRDEAAKQLATKKGSAASGGGARLAAENCRGFNYTNGCGFATDRGGCSRVHYCYLCKATYASTLSRCPTHGNGAGPSSRAAPGPPADTEPLRALPHRGAPRRAARG